MEFLNQKRFVRTSENLGLELNAGGQFRPIKVWRKQVKVREFRTSPIVNLAFYGFIAAIPFETISLGIPLEITVILLGLLFLSLVFQIPLVFQKPPLAFGLFFVYLVVFAAPLFLEETPHEAEAKWQVTVTVQLMAMSWIAYNLMRSEKVARNALLTLAVSCTLLAFLQLSGITRNASDVGSKAERVTALGFHPNNVARILALGLLALVGLAYGGRKSLIKPLYAVWIGFALIGISIVQTGSRGGLLALGAGILVFVLKNGSIAVKARNAFLVVVGIGFFALVALQSEETRTRFENALDDGDFARREQIYPTAWEMFTEKPIFGWGNKTAEYELGARLAHIDEESKNPHNLVLHLLVTTGVVGAIPMLAGIGLAVWAAWKARRTARGVLPLALMVTVLVANMSGVWINSKLHWFVLAYALSSAAVFAAQKNRRPARKMVLPTPGNF